MTKTIQHKRRNWSEMERQYIRDHYPHEPTKIVANDLNRSIASVYGHAKASGIAKSESFMESALSGRRNFSRLNTKKTQFKKGHIPANKGMKMPAHVYEKVKKSFFRKVQCGRLKLPPLKIVVGALLAEV